MIITQTSKFLVGIDEVGRGPIAGPVAVCALLWKDRENAPPPHIKDSKKLSPQKRDEWFVKIQQWKKEERLAYAVTYVSASVIDRIGINVAISRALIKSLQKLEVSPENVQVLLDGGLRAPRQYRSQQTIVKGDEQVPVIALASIAAKVSRDRKMERVSDKYTLYQFEEHKGYGTRDHYMAIKRHGMTPYHRRSFLTKMKNVKQVAF